MVDQILAMMLISEYYSLKTLISILIVIIATIGQCKSSVLIYKTENSPDTGEANCIFFIKATRQSSIVYDQIES